MRRDSGIKIVKGLLRGYEQVLTPEALRFVALLHRNFHLNREALLKKRIKRQREFNFGKRPDFLSETQDIRKSHWTIASVPKDLEDRRVEITGPVDAKMMINALNSGANIFMADFEDSLSPTWENVIQGQINLIQAVRKRLEHVSPEGKRYKLNDKISTLVVRPRGWHLVEKNLIVDGKAISASLFDFGLYFFHNVKTCLRQGTAPYFYLPKLESHLEARLWNDVFNLAQEELKIPRGIIKSTVLIETILAAFEMDEILYELRDHIVGLNAGRWDYIFSIIKKFGKWPAFLLPDRSQVTMNVPFMKAYTGLLVKICHRRGAHAIGGMSAYVPSRKDPSINEKAFEQVRADKEREANDGFDGTWVAHPDLVLVAKQVFDSILGTRLHQKERKREDVQVKAKHLLDISIVPGTVTENGIQNNISVALQYLERWLSGVGATVILNLMEDAATAEIARAQLWQWVQHKVRLVTGTPFTKKYYRCVRDEELRKIKETKYLSLATQLLDDLVLDRRFPDFLTIPTYRFLDTTCLERSPRYDKGLQNRNKIVEKRVGV